jgi:hypothetical protein
MFEKILSEEKKPIVINFITKYKREFLDCLEGKITNKS